MEAVTVYVVLKLTFFAGAENIRYFSYTYSEKDCVFRNYYNPHCFAHLRD